VLLRGYLETGESLLGTGTFKNIALLETAIVKATGVPFARVDFNVVGNHWIKRVLSFSAENLGGTSIIRMWNYH
jgi:malate/lactate dehydrogenase